MSTTKEKVKVGVTSVTNIMAIAAKTEITPIFWGPPGIGKTAGVRAFAKNSALNMVSIPTSTVEPGDITGHRRAVEVEGKGWRTRHILPDYVDILENGGVLFFDEFNTAPPSVIANTLHVLAYREVGPLTLDKRVIMAAAANSSEHNVVAVDTLPLAVETRMAHIHVEPQSDDVGMFVAGWGTPEPIRLKPFTTDNLAVARVVLSESLKTVGVETESDGMSGALNYRTADAAARVVALYLANRTDGTDDDAFRAVILGTIGPNAGWQVWLALQDLRVPPIEEIVNNPSAILTKYPELGYQVATRIAFWVTNQPNSAAVAVYSRLRSASESYTIISLSRLKTIDKVKLIEVMKSDISLSKLVSSL